MEPVEQKKALPSMQSSGMQDASPSVVIVDDNSEFRDSVVRLLRSVGLNTQQFSCVSDFLKADLADGPTCLVLDIRMPGGSGLELQRDLGAVNRQLPIVFITAHGDIPMTVQAMKGGAIEFLTKPFRDQDLLDAVDAGLARDRARREMIGPCMRSGRVSKRSAPANVDHGSCHGRSPEQTNSRRYRRCQIYGKGASHSPYAEDEGAFASRLSRMADILKLAPERAHRS